MCWWHWRFLMNENWLPNAEAESSFGRWINSNLVYTLCTHVNTDRDYEHVWPQWWHHYRAQSVAETHTHAYNWNSCHKFNRNLCNNNTWIKYHNIFDYSHSRCNQERASMLCDMMQLQSDIIRISLRMDCHTHTHNGKQ